MNFLTMTPEELRAARYSLYRAIKTVRDTAKDAVKPCGMIDATEVVQVCASLTALEMTLRKLDALLAAATATVSA